MKRSDFVQVAASVLPFRLAQWADALGLAGEMMQVCPFLLSSVMDRESRGGEALHPPGPGGTGDFGRPGKPSFRDKEKGQLGRGRGLMQVDDIAHPRFVEQRLSDGRFAWADAYANIAYGAQVLADSLAYFQKDRFAGLSARVKESAGVAGYNAGPRRVASAMARVGHQVDEIVLLGVINATTTGADYARAVLAKRDRFLAALAKGALV